MILIRSINQDPQQIFCVCVLPISTMFFLCLFGEKGIDSIDKCGMSCGQLGSPEKKQNRLFAWICTFSIAFIIANNIGLFIC